MLSLALLSLGEVIKEIDGVSDPVNVDSAYKLNLLLNFEGRVGYRTDMGNGRPIILLILLNIIF